MDIVRASRERGVLEAEGVVVPWVLGVLRANIVYIVEVFSVTQVDLIGCNPNDGSYSGQLAQQGFWNPQT